ncbi:hypothetical protein M430DRAFT_27546 [Amorphotheca resinae ATCC 22711]|uniref:Uncharacterized protein n=1 Tax=Amorphotheca resinae ATCC 22711 TaxID=857342 RepID=A0A2T3B4E5_AMORE|nr:hypothetical protein M430DRAFT_27546 [Amorphotheca resinae ATCC 22711]PSS20506.1 hypothetical protein M430DRAFT_27546 [Amorphotheca resinae ATCC 22711]
MELWAAGFNAWAQFHFDTPVPVDPVDLPNFTSILEDDSIEVLALSESAIAVKTSKGLKISGNPSEYMTHFASLCAERKEEGTWPIATAGNGKVADITSGFIKQYDLLEYDWFPSYLEKDGKVFEELDGTVTQIVANRTTFTALTSTGNVYTWGDEMYKERLGREVSSSSPASQPGIVEDLSNLPDKVVRISSGGAMTAALTSGNDVYFWGVGMSGPLGNLWSASPQPLDLDEQDILDVAVGNEHILILTTEHKVFAIGANGSGSGLRSLYL